jgi:outer membrane lipoprotein SlyB
MHKRICLLFVATFLANPVFAADAPASAAEKRYAEDRKLCADEPSSSARMQCLRDAKAEYDKAVGAGATAKSVEAKSCTGCGRVVAVSVVEKDGEGSAVGMVAGGVAGALLGNQIGKGASRDIATIAGAAGGAYAGNKIEQKVKSVKRWDVVVRFDNGSEKSYSFDKDPGFAIGSDVKSAGNSVIAR